MRTVGVASGAGFLFFFVGVIAACSSDDPAPAGGTTPVPEGGTTDAPQGSDAADATASVPGAPKRGTRLAPRFRETADGLSDFEEMIDTGLGDISCWPSRAGDGVMRCLPQRAASLYGQAYADTNCSTELAEWNAACEKPAFATKNTTPGSCATPNDVFDVGAPHVGQVYQRQNETTCVPVVANAKRAHYVVGAKRSPTDFVKLTQRTQPMGGGIGASMMDGEDGSSAPQYMLVDVARGRACIQGKATDLESRCVPSFSGFTGDEFTDNTCTKEAAQVQPNDCGDTLTVLDTATSSKVNSDGAVQVFGLGAKLPTHEFYTKQDQTCSGPGITSADVYERGAEIPAATFPKIGNTTVGGSRIVAGRWTAEGVVLPPTSGYRDTMLDVKCNIMTCTDGKERCLPQGASIVFSDDQCTIRVVSTSGTTPKYALALLDGCPEKFTVYAIGAEVTPKPTKLYQNFGGPCQETGSPDSATVYAIGAEIPYASFVEVTRVTR